MASGKEWWLRALKDKEEYEIILWVIAYLRAASDYFSPHLTFLLGP